MNYDFSNIEYGRGAVMLRLIVSLVLISVAMMVVPLTATLVIAELIIALATGARPPLALMRITDRLVCYLYQLTDYLIL
ncbi:MAG: DUF4389 domain-containing protein [Immundisolibacteraceae bacterium]|nr:DUF4389 domain-containing protein [Immundisolibacteraceae bacterium]